MNTPNKLTLLRIVLVPFFILFLLVEQIPYHTLWALIVFAAASFTDLLDGKIARKQNLVTNFGKFLDPLADKVLVISGLICFVQMSLSDAVVVIVIVAREFLAVSYTHLDVYKRQVQRLCNHNMRRCKHCGFAGLFDGYAGGD